MTLEPAKINFIKTLTSLEHYGRRKLILLVLAIAFFARFGLALMASHPGHGDFSFYYALAENLVNGRGFVIDYIWHYLTKPTAITHSALDFWMPLTSVIIAGFMAVLGKSLLVALLPSILFSLGLSILVYFWSRDFSESDFTRLAAAGLILFLPLLFTFSLFTDSTTYYVFFVTACFLCMARIQIKPAYFLFAAGFAGLAHLTRQDGLFLVPVILTMIALSSLKWRKKLWFGLGVLAIYLAILSPIWISNLQAYGRPLPPGPGKSMYFMYFEDVNSYTMNFSWKTYSAWGWGNIVGAKVQTCLINIKTLYDTVGSLIFILFLVALVEFVIDKSRRGRWILYLPPVLYGIIIYLFYSTIATIPSAGGAYSKSILSICPFMIIVAVDFIDRHISLRKLAAAIIVISGLLFLGHGVLMAAKLISSNNTMSRQLSELKTILDNQPSKGGEIVVMTRHPWEVYLSTRHKTIMIPNDDIETIYDVAQRYKANYLLLPAPRPALEDIYTGAAIDRRFAFVSAVPGSELKLFRISADGAIGANSFGIPKAPEN